MRYLYPILWQKCYNDFTILLNFLFTLGKLFPFHLASWHFVYNLVYNVITLSRNRPMHSFRHILNTRKLCDS
jgi:hypothetical protein